MSAGTAYTLGIITGVALVPIGWWLLNRCARWVDSWPSLSETADDWRLRGNWLRRGP